MIRLTGVNTLVFNEELSEGKKQQQEYFTELANLGVPFVEVRREFIRDFESELQATNKEAAKLGLALLYSIPSVLFVDGFINPDLDSYLNEAKELGAIQVKLTVGEYHGFNPEVALELKEILHQYPNIRLSIENDQSREGGSSAALKTFMDSALENELKLGLTFDTGNFVYIGENPLEAAKQLSPYVNYIHIKNVKKSADGAIAMSLYQNGDIPIADVMQAIDENERVIAAIEYPCGNKDEAFAVLKRQIRLMQSSR